VQAQQCVQLRSTNNPFGLIFYFSVKPFRAFAERQTEKTKDLKQNEALKFRDSAFGFRACYPYVDASESARQLMVES
jgi:hypothetical protein